MLTFLILEWNRSSGRHDGNFGGHLVTECTKYLADKHHKTQQKNNILD